MKGIDSANEAWRTFHGERQDETVNRGRAYSIHDMVRDALELHRVGRFTEAEEIYRRILTMDPCHADSLHLLGMIEYQAGHLETAAGMIRKAIKINSSGTSYYANLGTVLQAQGELDVAVAMYSHALALKPMLAEVHVNLGNVFQAQGKLNESVVCYNRALALKPESAEAHNNLGSALQSLGKLEDAIASYEQALAIRPDYAEVCYNMGNARRTQNKLDDAAACYHLALTIRPEYPEAHYNLGNVLRDQGKPDEALAQYSQAVMLRPEYSQAGFGEALAQLLRGDFAVGWQNFERRWQTGDHDTPRRAYTQPAWAGQKLVSGSLLIWGEQGVGDEIMFAGLISDVIRTGNRCILDCEPRLKPLFARSFPGVDVISGCGPGLHPELDIASHLPSGSLPGLFRKTSSAFATTKSPYLTADPAERARLRADYSDGKRLVGLAWNTNNKKTGASRSIDLSLFAPLLTHPEVRWVSLQYGDPAELERQAEAARAPILIDRSVDQLIDIDIFAAQIAAMDLVITIDNSTAHLAGALGVEVWTLLPYPSDWRWLLNREDSPWYPTMRLFRQPKLGDWQSVIQRVDGSL
jgi:tetratricopeptide (TPR) repeat protein